jgi:hypothetical protein
MAYITTFYRVELAGTAEDGDKGRFTACVLGAPDAEGAIRSAYDEAAREGFSATRTIEAALLEWPLTGSFICNFAESASDALAVRTKAAMQCLDLISETFGHANPMTECAFRQEASYRIRKTFGLLSE